MIWTPYALSLIKTKQQKRMKIVYDSWIEKKKQRVINENRKRSDKRKYHDHHACPDCLGGTKDKDNMVLLTLREHYQAHYFLWLFVFPKHYGIIAAFKYICNSLYYDENGRFKPNISAEMYEKL